MHVMKTDLNVCYINQHTVTTFRRTPLSVTRFAKLAYGIHRIVADKMKRVCKDF